MAAPLHPGPGAGRPSPWPVFEHRLTAYRRLWRSSVFSTFLLPVLFLLGMGVSVGAYVDRGGELGVPYLDYIAPGLLASTALQVALSESSWSIMGAFKWNRIYHAHAGLAAAPAGHGRRRAALRVAPGGHLGRRVPGGDGGVRHAALVVVGDRAGGRRAGRRGVSAPVLAFAATIKSDNMFAILFRFAIIPMTLFAGVFFPVDQMPLVARWIAYASPLWHGVELTRAATLGWPLTVPAVVHIGYLALWLVVGYALASWRYEKKLTD